MATFGDRLKQLRTESNLKQKECAELFHVQLRQYQRYEENVSTPKFDSLITIADYYNVSLDWLVGRSDKREISIC